MFGWDLEEAVLDAAADSPRLERLSRTVFGWLVWLLSPREEGQVPAPWRENGGGFVPLDHLIPMFKGARRSQPGLLAQYGLVISAEGLLAVLALRATSGVWHGVAGLATGVAVVRFARYGRPQVSTVGPLGVAVGLYITTGFAFASGSHSGYVGWGELLPAQIALAVAALIAVIVALGLMFRPSSRRGWAIVGYALVVLGVRNLGVGAHDFVSMPETWLGCALAANSIAMGKFAVLAGLKLIAHPPDGPALLEADATETSD